MRAPQLWSTTRIIRNFIKQYLSLTGTIRNCAGGPTPWDTWVTCEETGDVRGLNVYDDNETLCQEDHGYNFEVPATADVGLHKAVPLKAMGRFRHEAIAVDPNSGAVYETEDVNDGLIYRFLPNTPGKLVEGGKLQALVIIDQESADTRNWTTEGFTPKVGESFAVRWMDMDEVESPKDDLRHRGFAAGAARFARGEGMWYSSGEIYFACTSGGSAQLGQIWKYTPSPAEGTADESKSPGKLELFIEPNNSKLVVNADNLTAAPWGDLVVCEDRDGEEVRLVGVTPQGELLHAGQQPWTQRAGRRLFLTRWHHTVREHPAPRPDARRDRAVGRTRRLVLQTSGCDGCNDFALRIPISLRESAH